MNPSRRSFLKQLGLTTGGLTLFSASQRYAWAETTPGLPRSTLMAQGIDPAGIHAFLDAVAAKKMELHSLMLVRHGRVVAEGWWAPYERGLRHSLYSLSKSFTSTAIGMLVADGKLSVEDKVVSFFPNDLPPKVSDHLAAMCVKDLLTMSAGHVKDPTFEMVKSNDWLRFFLAWPVERAPGSHFVYNSGATYTLSAIVQQLSGKTLLELLQDRLFAPLGIDGATWESCPRAICTGGWGLSVTTEAMAKFTQLYRQNGVWNGREIIPAKWIEEATSKQVQQSLPDKPPRPNEQNDWLKGYGYQFWRCRHGAYRGDGAFGQLAVVMPDQDAVLVVTAEAADMQRELDLVWEHLLPAMKPTPLPADAAAEEKLRARLAALALPLPGGVLSATAARIAGKTFHFEKNDGGIESASFDFAGDSCVATFRASQREHRLVCGLGRWQRSESALPGTPPRLVSGGASKPGTAHPVSTAGAWKDDATFVLTLRFHETPHHDVFSCRFDGDKLEISFLNSIAAMSPKPADSRKTLRGTLA